MKNKPSAQARAALARAIKVAGSSSALARLMGVERQAVRQWQQRGVPPTRCIQLEKATGVKREELRSDIYE